MPVNLSFVAKPEDLKDMTVRAIIGRKDALLAAPISRWRPSNLPSATFTVMASRGDPGDDGSARSTWLEGSPERAFVGVLPETCSRHNTPTRAWGITRLVKAIGGNKVGVVVALSDVAHSFASALAVARAYPAYEGTSKRRDIEVRIAIVEPDGSAADPTRLSIAAEAVRMAARLVDMPPNELDTDAFVKEAQAVDARHPHVSLYMRRGQQLAHEGFGGLWGVGKAAEAPPALVVLDHTPPNPVAGPHDAWVGKGIVFDTGGLSLKTKTGMPGMKTDMGGAAAVLAAFDAAVKLGNRRRLTAVLCLAENAVGPGSTRPDDILHMLSGKTVEVNNTDAEGRLVLADGVAWSSKYRDPDRIVDLATLTGAQGIATGKRHAAIYTNNGALETEAVTLGREVGELVHPMPYCPEYFRREFHSRVADMRNSVKDRSNAQVSCAGEFIRSHIVKEDTPWLHIDLAAPAVRDGRGTGFGVGLLLGLADLVG